MKTIDFDDLPTFQGWKKNMAVYGLDAQLGRLFTNNAWGSFIYSLGHFLFIAGQLDRNFFREYREKEGLDYKIIVSDETDWQTYLSQCPDMVSFTRYAFSDQVIIDARELDRYLQKLPSQLVVVPIDKERYTDLSKESWSADLQGDFENFAHFTDSGGFGFVILDQEEIVAGISTGLVYQKAIEIEVATKGTYQRRGLAKILTAQMLKESQKRGIIPLWDAHNEPSKKVAEKLGYTCLGAYQAYELKETHD